MAFIYAILILLIISGIGTITYIIYYNALQDCKVKIDESESMIDEALRSKYDILLKLESLIKTNIKETKINFKDLNDLKKESISNFQLERKLVDTVLLINKIQDDFPELEEIKDYAKKAKELGFSAIKLMELVTSNENIDFIDLQDLLIKFGIHQKNATLKGCFFELPELSEYLGIKTYIKLCCPFNNVFKAKSFGIPDIEYQHDYMNVIQPDCSVTDSWIYDSFDNKILNGDDVNVNYLKK